MNNLTKITTKIDESGNDSGSNQFVVEYEIVQPDAQFTTIQSQHEWIESQINSIDDELLKYQDDLDILNERIDKYTNHSDKIDYAIAIASGLLCGLIDSLWVGDFSMEEGRKWSSEKINNYIIELAKKKGWKGVQKGNNKGEFTLKGAIKYLEDNFKMPSDPLKDVFGGGKQHHLRDFAHHRSPIGLFFSILTQFTGKAYGTDTLGNFIAVPVPEEMIGTTLHRKYAIAVTDWSLHLVSDMAGSNGFAGFGSGIPGPLLSLLKAVSALPIFKGKEVGDNKLSLFAAKLYNGTLLGHRDENGKLVPVKFDLRGEMALKHELGRQATPVIINECIVRSYYLIRRLCIEIKDNNITNFSDIERVDWKKVIPVGNRTITRMMTIASGTFMAVDLGDAAIRSAIKSGGNWVAFGTEMLLKVNYVGIGRFAIALGTDMYMGHKRSRLRDERINVVGQMIMLTNAKVFYKIEEMWDSAESSTKAIEELYDNAEKVALLVNALNNDSIRDAVKISSYLPEVEKKNPGLLGKFKDILKN